MCATPDSLTPIGWRDVWNVGHSEIDAQHRAILGTIDSIIRKPEVDSHRESAHLILIGVNELARHHFDTEEQILAAEGCPIPDAHRRRHDRYLEWSDKMIASVDRHAQRVPAPAIAFLRDWWSHHVVHGDMDIRVFFASKNEG